MDYTKYRAKLETTYDCICTIRRRQDDKDPVTRQTSSRPVDIYVDQPCRISIAGLPSNGQTDAQNDIRYSIKLFISPDLDIKQGDELTVTGRGRTRKYTAGEPFPYPTHLEVGLERETYA